MTLHSTDKLAAAVRSARERGGERGRRVRLEPGIYCLEHPLELAPEDSGLILEPAPDGRVVLCGGLPVSGWRREDDRLWSAPAPRVGGNATAFRWLVVNGAPARRARLPRQGEFRHLTRFDVPWMSTTGGGWKRPPTESELATLEYRPGDIGAWLDARSAELTVFHMWDESMVGLAAHDPERRQLKFSVPAGHPPGAFGVDRYVVWNLPEGLTEPGMWRLDRALERIFYWPLPGEDMPSAQVFAPTVEQVVCLRGTDSEPVRDIVLRGLSIMVANTPMLAGGFGACRFDGAVSAKAAVNCVFEDLEIFAVAGQGLKLEGDNLRVERCHVHDTGAGGILLQGRDHLVSNCRVHGLGRMYPSGIGIWARSGRDEDRGHAVRHNEVFDTPYTGIAASGNAHSIESNRIYRVMRDLRDGGAVYSTFCRGVKICGNLVESVADSGGSGASAYYLDEQAEDCLVEGNVALETGFPSHNHMALGNTMRRNYFQSGGEMRLTFPRCGNYVFEANVLVARGGIALSGPEAFSRAGRNIAFGGAGRAIGKKLDAYTPAGEIGLEDSGFTLADPLVAEAPPGCFGFAPGSPAAALGLDPVDVSRAGPPR